MKKWQKVTSIIVVCFIISSFLVGVGYLAGAYPVGYLIDKHVTPTEHPNKPVPTQYTDNDSAPISRIDATFRRHEENSTVFNRLTHDPMTVRDDGKTYLIVGTNGKQELYVIHDPKDPESWELVDGHYLDGAYEFDSIVNRNGTFIAYANGDVYTTEDISADNWKRVNRQTGFRDLGAYYDSETGLVHVYYERGKAAGGLSGSSIGHAVSPNGINNWTVYPPVWTAPDDYGVGDFEIIEEGGLVYILGDYDKHHPRYNVSVWVNNNKYSSFTQLDSPAISYRSGKTAFDDNYGVGDPALVSLGDGEYLMIANGYASRSSDSHLQWYLGRIGNQTKGRVGIEPTYDAG